MTEGQWRRLLRLPGVLAALGGALVLGLLARTGREDWAMATWARLAGRCVGLRVTLRGVPPEAGTLLAVNHLGYLDILALGAVCPGRFLAKSEIASWGFLGAVARWGGTLFVDRDRPRASAGVVGHIAESLREGHRVVLFPEAGVSPDGSMLRRFHPMFFEACVRAGRPAVPVAIRYTYPAEPRFWAWIEEPDLWRHLWTRILPCPHVAVEVRFGPPIAPSLAGGRKEMAVRAWDAVSTMAREDTRTTAAEGR